MQEVNNQLFTDTVYDEINLTSDTDDEKINICMVDMQIAELKKKEPSHFIGRAETEGTYSIGFTFK